MQITLVEKSFPVRFCYAAGNFCQILLRQTFSLLIKRNLQRSRFLEC